MDFKKIYADFTTTEMKNDFEKMSEILLRVDKVCSGLAKAGRANEIPPEAYKIANYTHVLIYQIVKFLHEGDVAKAKFYMTGIKENNTFNFVKFFYLIYLVGKVFYAAGEYSWALKNFESYEKIRHETWGDVDELTLFYRANCLALLGDKNAAAELYERILTIKADFPEAKNNLKFIRGDTRKNFSLEVKSLWNFPNWRDVPIFINARDRLVVMKKLIDWLLGAGYRKIFILDNDSTYPPLLEYYSALESNSRIKIIRLKKKFGLQSPVVIGNFGAAENFDTVRLHRPRRFAD